MCLVGKYLSVQSLLSCRSRLSITFLRNRLRVDTVEAVECLHRWRQSGLITIMQKQLSEKLWDEDMALTMALDMEENSGATPEE